MKNNPLLDSDFLVKLDQQKKKELYAKVISLSIDELPIEEITGRVTGGSINIDGNSAIRRSCSVNLIAQDININDYYWGVNTKFQLYIGVENTIDDQYDKIIWFKQGVFLITNFNTALQLNGYNISIQGKDKMCLLNGDIAGTINSLTVDFGKYDQIDENGNILKRDYLVREIIKEAIHQYAREPYGNIIIKDLDMTGLELLEYRGDTDLFLLIDEDNIVTGYKFADQENIDANSEYYLYISKNSRPTQKIALENVPVYDNRVTKDFGEELAAATKVCTLDQYQKTAWTVARIQYGDTCGYRETELVYPKDLISNIGESITQSLLDKLVQMLGEYEYFYDIDGHFIFQRKATYNDNSWNSIQNSNDPDNLYVENAVYTSALTYSFLDSNLITAFQNTPNLTNLKNDFAIWGTKKSGDNEIPIHLRYAIDEKPSYYKSFSGKIYITKDEYDKLKTLNILNEDDSVIIISNQSRFKTTPLPKGLSDGWWEIDDWTRRYLYFADVNNEHDIDYYLRLSGEEVTNIITEYKDAALDNPDDHNFIYYVKYLANTKLGAFATKWATEDWLNVFPQPSNISINSRGYYNTIINAINNGKDYWCWMFDTDYSDETGKEYIVSIEHGGATTLAGEYPIKSTGCNHFFSFPYTDSYRKQNNPNYHVYIYDPDIPDSLKDDTTFVEKDDNENSTIIENASYFICDWREIIYQMAYDYYHYQHNDNYSAILAKNNARYYPDGFTKYEQYYIDIYGFWRDIYNPFPEGIKSHVVDMSLGSLFLWENNDFVELPLDDEQNVIISKPQDVVDEDGLFYYVSGKDKYTPYVVSQQNESYYLQDLYKDLSAIRYDPSKTYMRKDSNGISSSCPVGYKRVFLSKTSYRNGYYFIKNGDSYELDPEYKLITFSDEIKYLPQKYYIIKDGEYKLDDKKVQRPGINYYVKNSFDENTEYYEEMIYFQLGYKYFSGDEWQKVNNFAAGIQYYTQNYYQLVSTGGEYIKNDNNIFTKGSGINAKYIKVSKTGPNVEIGYEEEIYVDPTKDYYEYLTTSSMNIYSKITAFLKGKRYYIKQGDSYIYDDNVIFYNNKAYYIKIDDDSREFLDLTDGINTDYYYTEGKTQGIISSTYTYDKDNRVFEGSIMRFFPGDIYFSYNKQDYSIMDNGYYYLKGQYYYLSTSAVFNPSLTYYSDIYGTVAAITREEYIANKYYLKGNNNQQMFTKYNILYRFKKGFDYFIIENENNKSLITERNYLLATFYPREETIFYYLVGKDFIPTSLTLDEFNNRDKDYYLAYGKYNYYCYTDRILNNLILLQTPYNKEDIYYNNESGKTLKQNYVGQLSEDEWILSTYYTLTSQITFKKSSSYSANKKYYILPALNSDYLEDLLEEDWNEDLYELLNENGIYKTKDFNIKTYWNYKTKYPESLVFWFDFLDVSSGGDLAQYSAHLIGDRPKSINDKDVRSIYYRDIPTVIFKDNNSAYIKIFINEEKFNAGEEDYYIYDDINDQFVQVKTFDASKSYYIIKQDGTTTEVGSENYLDTINMYATSDNILSQKYSPTKDYYRKWNYSEDGKTGYTYVNILSNLNNLFAASTQKKSTFDILDNFLYNNSYCIETISITAIPIYHLSPNTRILVRDDKTGINGEYIVSKISLPLTYNGTMNISATKAVKRIY